jgi:hypothetical protein
VRFVSALAAVLMPVSAHAHHSGALYDMSRQITVEGTVTKVAWANPHVYLYVSQPTSEGRTVDWQIEAFPPATMRRHGWSPDTLRSGDAVAVMGSPARNAADTSLFPTLIRRGDDVLYEQAEGTYRLTTVTGADAAARGLDGTWATLLALDVITRFATGDLPLNDAGKAALASFDDRTMNPGLDCRPNAAPLFMIDPDIKRISRGDGVIRIGGAYGADERIVHLNVASHEGAAPSLQGHSIGRFDGATLVIDTALFAEHRTGNGYAGVPSGHAKRLTERLTVDASGKTLLYSFQLTDPEFLASPVSGRVQWAHRPDLEFVAEPCDLETARRFAQSPAR